ncbi:GNAT family N-acetyltransferase [Streptomyces sp. NPDC002573]|uniref:GNAT family N-acetyltransferase n=1 Tax=Streptomyces sp. NPDC002573 TaxID=3364651 RepID=UPI00368F0BD5
MIASTPAVVPAGRMSQSEQPVFRLTGDVELRPWRQDDAQVIVDACLDPDIQQWNRPGRDVSLEDAQERIVRWHERWKSEQSAIWAVAQVGERPMGLIGWGDIDLKGGSAEILYWLLPTGRGSGVMVDATLRVSRWAMDDLGLHRLRLTHSVANPASCRVATKAGFALEGTMRSALLHTDGWHDEHLHARIRGDERPSSQGSPSCPPRRVSPVSPAR